MLAVGCSQTPVAQPEVSTSCGHAHNDYEHPKPLTDALSANFCSVEADVFLENGALLVAHELSQTDASRTLQSLYLTPLSERVAADGQACACDTLVLLIDVKSEAVTTYAAIHDVLQTYASMLTHYDNGTTVAGAVTAIISGNRDRAGMEAQATRYAAMDGRLSDLGTGAPLSLIPLVSDNWVLNLAWYGTGDIPAEVQADLNGYVAEAHDEGRLIRFWASPDTEVSWAAQRTAGVDLINSDNLTGLQAYFAASNQ